MDPLTRGEARLLLDRITAFEDFRTRWMRANGSGIAQSGDALQSSNRIPVQQASFKGDVLSTDTHPATAISNMAAAQEIIRAADASAG